MAIPVRILHVTLPWESFYLIFASALICFINPAKALSEPAISAPQENYVKIQHNRSMAPIIRSPAEPVFTEAAGLVRIPASLLDPRSDAEITSQLLRFQPVTSQKNIWAFWDTGFSQMRPYVKRNIIGWVRRLGPEWTVRVLDHVEGSPMNVEHYLDRTEFHDAFNNRAMTGPYVGAHSGDVVRLPLLFHYGGVWLDVGTTLFRHMDDICWNAIEDPSTPYEIAGFATATHPGNDVIMNGFIAATKGNLFVRLWHEVFLEVWRGRTDCTGVRNHPLLRQVQKVDFPKEMQEKFDIDNSLMNDYVGHTLAFNRVRMLQDESIGFNGPEYWEKHAYVLSIAETFLAQIICKLDGQRQYDLLAMPRDSVKEEDRDPDAEYLVHQLLSNASTMKLSHGIENKKLVNLSKIWDMQEHADADITPGTYAAFLRWGSVHLDQTRTLKSLPVKCSGGIIKAGVLEAVE
ncbi:hypothetical protein B0I35DRAFT_439576 [Stachybotrys elegans]|uniref:Capsule polysaccharide biosynthesis protein n=1 Tax=Stachybotrys elegans TaxID=80388 RepID=A0A8K0WNN6_9HYPO|nr:hypothetical protein B0I35DRAFT_439576 [Stachybotrys elegans]